MGHASYCVAGVKFKLCPGKLRGPFSSAPAGPSGPSPLDAASHFYTVVTKQFRKSTKGGKVDFDSHFQMS